MAKKKLTGRGGPDRGQGRHKLSDDEPTVDTTIAIPKSYRLYLSKLGGGVVSKGVRMLVEWHQKHTGG